MNPDVRILLADPDNTLRASARRALEREGYTVTVASDGADALARLAFEQFDVIVAAILMAQRDGLEVLREVRVASPETQIILLSELGAVGSAALGLREGAFAYIPKPIEDFRQLAHTVARAVELQRLRRRVATRAPEPPRSDEPERLTPVTTLRRLTDDARSGKPLPGIFQFLLQASADLFTAPHAALLLSHGDAGLQIDSAFGYEDPGAAARDFLQTVGDAFAWRVATERETIVESSSASERFIGTPLVAKEQLLGVLVVYPVLSSNTDPAHIASLESLAAQGALVLETARLGMETERLTPTDPLTGALKRGTFVDMGDREFRRAWRFNQPLTAIVLDVDGMSEINARHSRQFGDEILRQVANACRSTVRAFDLVARYDADAFALLLVMTDRAGARGASERVRLAVNSIDVTSPEGPIHITASFGACTYPREGCASVFDLLDLAQTAQRTAHRNGANHVLFA